MNAKVKLLTGLVFALFGLAGGAIYLAHAGDPSTKEVMQLKLGYAQKILEGIATEDFDLILQNAQKLEKLSQATGWYTRQTPEYGMFTTEFRRHVKSLQRAAKEKNVDAATGAYFQMTVSCTSCHKYIRGRNVADRPGGKQAWGLRGADAAHLPINGPG